ncbi:MAG: epsF3 [Anaerospora sp.]|jgi:glycosyltransferase involved in cell wall biosynthesis|nr:epsF3 [Anaerospora sp.]
MKALFVFSGRMLKHNNIFYSTGLPSNIWTDRYLKVFDELIVCTRYRTVEKDQVKGLKESSTEGVTFHCTTIGDNPIEMYTKRWQLEVHIENEVKQVDYVIARISLFGIIAVKYAKKHNKPYIIEVVGSAWDANWNHSFKGKLQAPYLEWLVKQTVKKAPYVVYVTQEYLQKVYPTNGKSIGISNVSLTDFDSQTLSKRLEKIEKTRLNDTLIVGTTAGVNVKYKGQQYVIEAISCLNKEGYNFQYHLVGEGDQAYLKSVAKKFGVENQIKFLGCLSHNDVFKYLDSIDIYAQPSLQEGLPRALVEAMSRGLPAFGARTAGIPELLDDEVICRRKSIDDICTILKKMDRKFMVEQAKRNYEKSKEYDKEILDMKRINFLKEFCGRQSAN